MNRSTIPLLAVALTTALLVPGATPGADARPVDRPVAAPTSPVEPPRKPPVHTYQVTYTLAGHLDVETFYRDESDGFCTGTGFNESADYATGATWVVKLTVGKAGQAKAVAGIQKTPTGGWQADGIQVAVGDDCAQTSDTGCSGTLTENTSGGATTMYAQTTARSAGFQVALRSLPTEHDVPADCRQEEDYYPVLDFGLFRALRAWRTLQLTLPWTKLKDLAKGQSITRSVRYRKAPEGYALTSCDHSPPCVATMPQFTHTIRVKRTR